MPLLALALLSYVAGLLAGFGGASFAVVAAAVLVAIVALVLRRLQGIGLALAFAGGVLAAMGTRARDETCLAAAATVREWEVTVDASASPGDLVPATSTLCGAPLRLSVDAGHAAAGSRVRVTGKAIPGERGLLIDRARVHQLSAPGPLRSWRTAAGESIDSTFREDAPLARALLVADTRDLAPELRDRFAAAGLAHVLSISGLHVGIIALALEVMFALMRMPRRTVAWASVGVVVVYVAVIGAPPPAVRAAAMLIARAMSRSLQRPTSPWAILAIGAAGPLADPHNALDVGYQLSVVGVGALIAGGALVNRIGGRSGSWRHEVAAAVVGSTLATIASAPLVAWTFGRVSMVGPLVNLAAGPLVALAQPMLFAGLVLGPFHGTALFIADAVHPLLYGLNWIASAGAALPFARMTVAPSVIGALLASALVGAVLFAAASSAPGRALVVGAAALVGIVWVPLLPAGSGMAELHVIDVGQGDAIALRTPRGHWVLFDAGRSWMGGDAGKSTIIPYIGRRGGQLDAFVLSHPHTDHVGGAASVVIALHPSLYVDAAFAAGNNAYRSSLVTARERGVRWQRVHPGDSLVVDGVVIGFLAPDSAWTVGLKDPNLASTIALVRFGDIRFLLVGDAEAEEEQWLLDRVAPALHADVLKVGHHGSSTSSTAEFLDAVRPRVALISVGAGNTYGHPSPAVLARLAARGARVLRTDLLGTVVVRTDGRMLELSVNGDTWKLPESPRP